VWFDGPVHGRRLHAAAAVAILVLAGAACGDDDDDASSTTTTTALAATTTPGPVGSASAELCEAREDLRTSISGLSDVDVVRNGTSAITDALSQIKDDLGAVRSAAGSDVQPQVDAFQEAVDALQAALSGSDTPPVRDIVAAVQDVGTTGATLLTSLGNLDCP
jgi:hypothetical protein